LRFDDSLETVLSADMSTPFGAQSAWRQLVDLIGRRRVPPGINAIAKLRAIRVHVPPPIRAASARGLAFADPPAPLVQLFAEDELSIAAPVLRTARLRADEWTAMLSGMSPAARSILRHRRDLPPAVNRALESYGSVDFVLSVRDAVPAEADAAPVEAPETPIAAVSESEVGEVVAPEDAVERAEGAIEAPVATEAGAEAATIDWTEVLGPLPADEVEASAAEAAVLAPPESTFVSIASVALGLPVVAEALRQTGTEGEGAESAENPEPVAPVTEIATLRPPPVEAATGMFQIAELVARIDAYQRQRGEASTAPIMPEIQPELFELESIQAQTFRFETDASGVVRWIEGATRAPLIGLSLDVAALPNGSRVDGVATGAFRRRAGFANARLVVDGDSGAAGQWRITGIPVFDRDTGRFTGYRGTARRPRPDETAEPRQNRNPASDALRQLVHELRTPTNAIAGFAEMIESQLLGPVPQAYRAHAADIRSQASGLLTAIDDIDMAARIESNALDLRPGEVPIVPLLDRIADDLAPLCALRGTTIDIYTGDSDLAIAGDDRAVERLIARLMATLVASGGRDERIGISATLEDGAIALVFDRPQALAAYAGDSLLTIDAETEADREGAPLLGTGFALRLARNLATELRGSLVIGDNALTLRLPAAVIDSVEQVSSS
jgi:signal transduction histidine kinase